MQVIMKLLTDLLNPNTKFYKWYKGFSSKITNVNQQYEKLKDSLYFDNDIDIISSQIQNMVSEYDAKTKQKSKIITETISPRKELKMQLGGNLLSAVVDAKIFIVGIVKYITGDQKDDDIIIHDTFTKKMDMRIKDMKIIDMLKSLYLESTNISEAQKSEINNNIKALYRYSCRITLIDLYIYELNLSLSKTNNYIFELLNKKIKYIEQKCTEISDRIFENTERQILKQVKFSGNESINELREKIIKIRDNIGKTMNKLFNKIQAAYPDRNKLILAYNAIERNIQEPLLEAQSKQNLEEWIAQHPIIALNEIVLEYPEQRRLFMIEIDNKRYAIKMSTHRYEQYYKEGLVYGKFREIINDKNEPEAEIIKERVLYSHYFGEIDVKKNIYQINLTPELTITVSNNINNTLWYAIDTLSSINVIDEVYYYTTENMLGEWETISNLTLQDKEICSIASNLIDLLSYLNDKYNFIHWDLHIANVLINKKNTNKFKIFDFDQSEITYKDDSTSINNYLLRALGINIDDELYKNPNMRKDFGLIYDINRFLDSYMYFECNNHDFPNLSQLKKEIYARHKGYQEGTFWEHLLNLIALTKEMYTVKLDDISTAQWIREKFNINKKLVGGALYFKKYQKYKLKYLNLKKY